MYSGISCICALYDCGFKNNIDRCSWWVHTLRLQGKPIVVLSTCDCNGYRTVIEPLSEIMTFMGGNVIATANGSQIPNQLNNEQWLNSISDKN